MRTMIFFMFLLLSFTLSFAEIIHVPGDYPTIQEAIDAANPGDIVMVAPGVYYEEITLKADVDVIGAGEGLSIIDGGGDYGDVVTAVGGSITSNTKFQGFTVTGAISGGSMPGGAGIFCNMTAEPEICNNRVEGNDFGVELWNGASAYVHNNVIIDNMYTGVDMSSLANVINNTISNNGSGGVHGNGWGNCIVMNNIITGNSSYGIGTGTGWPPPIISYNDVWNNGVNYQNCSAGTGDISSDPLFVDEPNGDFHLQSISPCIDSGNPNSAYNDPDGSRNDMGAYGGPGAAVSTPEVSFTIPTQNELNVLYGTDVSAIFSVDMDSSTINSLTFRAHGNLTGLHTGTVSYDSASKLATLNPDNDFTYGEVVTSILTKDIQSFYGDSLEGYVWQFTSIVDGGSGLFAPPVDYAVNNYPNSVITADFNNNGVLDLAAVNEGSNNVSILLGNGDGTFSTATNFSCGTSPYAVCTGDFNSDGNLDLAAANWGSNDVSILLGNGDGSFGAAANYPAGSQPMAVCYGDFDLDGNLDIAISNPTSDDVSILLGNGDGSFNTPGSYPVGNLPLSLCTADFDNDGFLDIATANGNSNNISILLGYGDGTFASATNFPCGDSPFSVCTGDFDGDGDLDLGAANGGSNNVSILLGNGNGSFSSPVTYFVGLPPYAISTSDIDGDGNLDLAVALELSYYISVLIGIGDGSFSGENSFSCGLNPHSVVGGDFDGDGDIDLCTANYGDNDLSILLNEDALVVIATNPYQFQIDAQKSTNITAAFNTDLNVSTLDSTSFLVLGTQTGPHYGTISYDGDSLTATLNPNTDFIDGEMVTALLTKDIQATTGVYLQGFTWSFTIEVTTPSSGTFGNAINYGAGTEPRGMFAGDLDFDDDVDIVTVLSNYPNPGAAVVLLNNGDGTFGSPSSYSLGAADPLSVFGADLDGDGDIDIATAHNEPGTSHLVIMKNNGNGIFSLYASYAPAVLGQDISGGDFDLDGDIDLVMGDSWGTNPCVLVMVNNGSGNFSGPYAYSTGLHTRGLAAADVENDGDIDIIVSDNASSISILLNDGNGNFPTLAVYQTESNPNGLYVNDLNGDGYTDIAAASYSGDNVQVLLNNGDGSFGSASSYNTGSSTRRITGGDFDGDGDIDLSVSVNGADSVSVIFNNGNGTYTNLTKYHVGDNPWGIKSADFDLDGDLDLACANFNSNNVSVLLNTGTEVSENPKDSIHKPFLKVYPNPFTDRVDVRFSIGLNKGNNELKIYDVSGRLVRSFFIPTDYSVLHTTLMWDGKDSKGKMVPSGIYFCKLKTSKKTMTRKIICVR